MNDDELIGRARAGDAGAMEALLTSVAPAVERFARRLCRGADADDAAQETLLAVATNLRDFEGRSALSSWVFALARTACSRQRRGLKNQPHDDDAAFAAMPDEAPDPEARASGDELTRALHRALGSLEREQREVIVLRDMEGLTAPEAAAALGVSVDAVKSRLHRARAALRDALRPALEPAPATTTAAARCPDVIALWSKRLEGELSPEDCADMERHLGACPACGAACDALKRTLWACQGSRTTAVTPQMRARVARALAAWGAASR